MLGSVWSRSFQFDLVAPERHLRHLFLVCYATVTRHVELCAYSWENLLCDRFVIAHEVRTGD